MKTVNTPLKLAGVTLALCLSGQLAAQNCSLNPDEDGDGYQAIACGGSDCDDHNPNRYPGAVEVCDVHNVDEDCDYSTFGERDADADGFVDALCRNFFPDGTVSGGEDCDDFTRTVHPMAPEVCNGFDDNCDGDIDHEAEVPQYTDWDLDGHGDPGDGPFNVCPGTAGFSTLPNDCDDNNPAIRPGDTVCVTGAPEAILTCSSSGQWLSGTCATGVACVTQTNGLGLCIGSVKTGKK